MSFEKISGVEGASESFPPPTRKKEEGVEQKVAKVSRRTGVGKGEGASIIRAKKTIAALAGKSKVPTLPHEAVTQVSKNRGRDQSALPKKKIKKQVELSKGEKRGREEVEGEPEEELKERSEKRREPSTRKKLLQAQSEKPSLDLIPKGKMPRPFGLSDSEIIDLSGTLGEKYNQLVKKRDTIKVILKRLYFETQGAPTAEKGLGKPGDIAVLLKNLDGSSKDLMFVNFYKNIKAFYEHLREEEQSKNDPLFRSLFEKLEKARSLFLQFNKDRTATTQRTVSQIKALREGESLILPGGITGHAMLYEVKKENDGTCSFTVFNSGEGLAYHGAVGRKFCNIRIRTIDPTKLNEDFFQKLHQYADIDCLYSHLQSLGPLDYDESAHYDQGGIGSCAYQCLLRWLKGQMGKELYHELRQYTVQALLDDCAVHFGGRVRADGSVREIIDRTIQSHSGRVKGQIGVQGKIIVGDEEFQEADIAKLRNYAERCIQKIGRNIQIGKAVEAAITISDKATQTKFLLSLIDNEEIQKIILDDQDRCLVLLKISSSLASRGPAFLETAKFIRDQAITEAEKIKEPEKRTAIYYEIAQSLFIQGNKEEAFKILERASESAKDLSDSERREKAFRKISRILFTQEYIAEAVKLIENASKNNFISYAAQDIITEATLPYAKKVIAHGDKEEMKKLGVLLSFIYERGEEYNILREIDKLILFKAQMNQGNKSEYYKLINLALEIKRSCGPLKDSSLNKIVRIFVSTFPIEEAKEAIEHVDPQDRSTVADAFVEALEIDPQDRSTEFYVFLDEREEVDPRNQARINLAFEIATSYISDTDPQKSDILRSLSKIFTDLKQYAKAEELIALIPDLATKAHAYLSNAKTLFSRANKVKGKRFMSLAIETAGQISDPKSKSEVFQEIAEKLFDWGEKERAKILLIQAIEAAGQISDPEIKSWIFQEIVQKLFDWGEKERAKILLIQAIEAAGPISNPEAKFYIFQEIAKKLIDLGEKERAKILLNQAIETAGRISKPLLKYVIFKDIARTLFSQGDKEGAKSFVNQALQLFTQTSDMYRTPKVLEPLLQILIDLGDIEGAKKAAELIPEENGRERLLQKIPKKSS